MNTLYKIKQQLSGPNFTKLMKKKKTNKYRICRAVKVSYPTLRNWETGRCWPKDENAIKVGKYLGLIKDSDEVLELERQVAEIKAKLERLR